MRNYHDLIQSVLKNLLGRTEMARDANKAIDALFENPKFKWYPSYVANDKTNYYLFSPFTGTNYLDMEEFKEECKNANQVVEALHKQGKNCQVFFIVEQVSDVKALQSRIPRNNKDNFGILHNEFSPATIEHPVGSLSFSQNKLLLQPLEHLSKTKNLKGDIARILKKFSKNYLSSQRSAEADCKKIKKLIDALLCCDKRFKLKSGSIQFIKSTEDILSQSKHGLRDHYFHACNTMIIGFVIMEKFYKQFAAACNVYGGDIVPEFIWAITSLYHDIGYPAALYPQMLVDTYVAEDDRPLLEESARQMRQRLWDGRYKAPAHILEDLYSHTRAGNKSPWEHDGFERRTSSPAFLKSLELSFVETGSHGAQGVLILMSLINEAIREIKQSSDRKYLYRHIVLAAVSMLFHDASVRKTCRENGIDGIRISEFPIAGLLAYVDILQDDRRDISGVLIRPDIFKDIVFDKAGISARLNARVIDASRKTKLYNELKEAFEFFIDNGLKFIIPKELQSV